MLLQLRGSWEFRLRSQYADGTAGFRFVLEVSLSRAESAWLVDSMEVASRIPQMLCHLWQNTTFGDGRRLEAWFKSSSRVVSALRDWILRPKSGGLLAAAGTSLGTSDSCGNLFWQFCQAVDLPDSTHSHFFNYGWRNRFLGRVRSIEVAGGLAKGIGDLYVSPISGNTSLCDRILPQANHKWEKHCASNSPRTADILDEFLRHSGSQGAGKDESYRAQFSSDEVQQYIATQLTDRDIKKLPKFFQQLDSQ